MTLSVIIPARDAADTMPACLAAIAQSTRPPDEVIVLDDGSSDDTGALAARSGATVLSHTGSPLGPAMARNRAVEAASGQVLVFVDADVVVHPDAIERLVRALNGPRVVAAFGSYDDRPPARNLASLYMNLRHHGVHQQGAHDASTFWAGLGAVRRDAFIAAEGFSARFGKPSIEDIELGMRLIAAGGRICLVREALGTHWKRWGLRQMWRTDLLQRAVPWSRLIAEHEQLLADLNASAGERRSAVLAHLVPVAWLAGLVVPLALLPALALSGGYVANNRRLYRLFWRRAPRRMLPAMAALHWTYHIYASQILGWTLVARRLSRRDS